MSEADAVAIVLFVGLTMYAVFGGADFGAGLWSLLAGGGERGRRPRQMIDSAIGPVWEANHVWLIFVLVVLWTGFSPAFEAIFSTLFIPLTLAALGIVLRGAGFAFHHTARRARGRDAAQLTLRAQLHPDAVLHGHGGRRDRGGPRARRERGGRQRHELAQPTLDRDRIPLRLHERLPGGGVPRQRVTPRTGSRPRAVLRCPRNRCRDRRRGARGRRPDRDAEQGPFVYDGLTGDALPLVIVSLVCGAAAFVLLHRNARRGARPLAVGAVAAMIWAWGVAQHPYLLPQQLTIADAAAPKATLTSVLIVFGVAVVLVIPAIGLLFTLVQRNYVAETTKPAPEHPARTA